MNSSGEEGSTLLEVLVALVILLVTVGAFYQAFGIGLRAEEAAQREHRSAEVAANLLASLGRSQMLQDGVTNGELPDGYRWTLRLDPFIAVDPNGLSPVVEGHLATLDVQEMGRSGTALRVQTLVLGVQSQ